ncbi:hypothetical protein C0J52_00726 [Blattella germanica]|nr:hypothetical protein C0J52_00726 [Blattella germanica]
MQSQRLTCRCHVFMQEPSVPAPTMNEKMTPVIGCHVINLLECPLCRKGMPPPIYLCENGHTVCSSCHSKTSTCPVCDAFMTKKRDLLVERFAEKLPFPCSNCDLGCKEKLVKDDLQVHETICPHRLYHCVPCQPRCRWRGRKFEVLEHMKEEHKELVWVKCYNSLVYENFDVETDYVCTHILSCLKEIFWCHSKRDAKQGKLFEVVQYIGRKEKAQKFEYEFEFYSKGNNRTAVFRNVVLPEEEDVEKAYASGDCLILDFRLLKHFITDGKKLFYNFKLLKSHRESDHHEDLDCRAAEFSLT